MLFFNFFFFYLADKRQKVGSYFLLKSLDFFLLSLKKTAKSGCFFAVYIYFIISIKSFFEAAEAGK